MPLNDERIVRSVEEVEAFVKEIGLPIRMWPAFTLGHTRIFYAETLESAREAAERALNLSMVREVKIERFLSQL